LNQENINHLNISRRSNEIEVVIKTLPKKKSPEPNGFSAEYYQTFKEELIPTLLNLLQEIEREGTLTDSFYAARIIPIPKPEKDRTIKENYRPISLMDTDTKFLIKY
jgi:hypothetical protein